jgi:hypothetical protein
MLIPKSLYLNNFSAGEVSSTSSSMQLTICPHRDAVVVWDYFIFFLSVNV